MIIIKFGGTSVGEIPRLEQAIEIVAARQDQSPIVVVSALSGVTDQLVAASRAAAEGNFEASAKSVAAIRERHTDIAWTLIGQKADFYETFESQLDRKISGITDVLKGLSLVGEVSKRANDLIVALGEQRSSVLFTYTMRTKTLDGVHIDSGDVIVTDQDYGRAEPVMDATTEAARRVLLPELERHHIPVMGGFFGRSLSGVPTTLGRGGSDYSAAIVGAAIGADEIQIWTDVDGVMTCDPSVIPDARPLDHISYDEAAELAYLGARVLHPKTLRPAMQSSIPVRVLNTHHPENPGTLITSTGSEGATGPRGIALQRGLTIIRLTTTRMLGSSGYLAKFFAIFAEHDVAVDVLASSEVSVSVTVEDSAKIPDLLTHLAPLAAVDVKHEQAIVAIVGKRLTSAPSTLARVFSVLEGIPITLLSLGSADISLTIAVSERDADEALRRIHDACFGRRT